MFLWTGDLWTRNTHGGARLGACDAGICGCCRHCRPRLRKDDNVLLACFVVRLQGFAFSDYRHAAHQGSMLEACSWMERPTALHLCGAAACLILAQGALSGSLRWRQRGSRERLGPPNRQRGMVSRQYCTIGFGLLAASAIALLIVPKARSLIESLLQITL